MMKSYARPFVTFFIKGVKTLGASVNFYTSSYSYSDPINNRTCTCKYKNHPGMKKKSETTLSTFHFSSVDKADVEKAFKVS